MIRSWRGAQTAVAAVLALSAALCAFAATAPSAAADGPQAVAPQQLASGLSDVKLGQLAVARDGTGALVFTATAGGTSHVYLSRLLNGSFAAPVQLDTGAMSGASQPVVTADNGGELLVAFVSGSNLYVAETPGADAPLSAPQLIATGASNPSISINLYGVGYLAYTQAAGSGDDVDVQYFNGASWAPATPEIMNPTPGDNAGTGTGAPSVVSAGDGVGIVTWGEGGHIYSRRVWGTATSTEIEQDDVASYAGLAEVSATDPQIASGGDSTYPDIVFTETFQNGSSTQTRAMVTRLVAEQTRPAVAIDGLAAGGSQSGLQPQVAMGELGRGLITAATASGGTNALAGTSGQSYGVEGTVLGNNGAIGTPSAFDPAADATEPYAVPAMFGSTIAALAWDQSSGVGLSQVLLRYSLDGTTFANPVTLSSTSGGAIQAADGLELAGDSRGDGAVAWVQGSSLALSVDVDQIFTPPGGPGLNPAHVVSKSSQPVLTWNGSAEDWGPVTYSVSINGQPVGSTQAHGLTVPSPLADNTYSWQVTGTNVAGQTVTSETGSLLVDTYPPRLRVRFSGAPRVKTAQHVAISYSDPANPTEPGARASGVKSVSVNWGDKSKSQTAAKLTKATHTYTRAGLYKVTVSATDAATNTTTVTHMIRVLPK